MQRRELLALGGMAAALAGSRTLAQTGAAGVTDAKLTRIYATPDGESHFEDLVISPDAGPLAVTQMTAGVYRGSGATAPDWHTAPRRQFAINMTGSLEVEISNGTRRKIGPGDLVFLEDLTGRGHVTRALGPITNLFIHVAEDFDVVAWSRGA
jgi:quercetin dioxygenase-like cupin family protein